MPNVMIRREAEGHLSCYIAKKDLEEKVVSMEFESADKWGGTFSLSDGSVYFITPLDGEPNFPITLRATRG